MPLFGHKNHATDNSTVDPNYSATGATTGTGIGSGHAMGPGSGSGMGPGSGGGLTGYNQHQGAGVGAGAYEQDYAGQTNVGGPHSGMGHHSVASNTGMGGNQGYQDMSGNSGIAAGVANPNTMGDSQGIPSGQTLHAQGGAAGTGPGHKSGSSTTGKIESAIGSMIGSNSLKAKGLAKQQEAQSLHMQGAELGEAERLEKEAMMRRERAVAHGAHPHNKHLGGVDPANSGSNPGAFNDPGVGSGNYGGVAAGGRGGIY